MESLSGNQIQDLKELYSSIYNQTIDETTANLQNLDKEQRDAMKGKSTTITLPDGSTKKVYEGSPEYDKAIKNKNKVNNNNNNNNNNNKEIKKEPIVIKLPNGTKKIFPGSPEYEAASKGELTTSKSDSMTVPDVINIKKNQKGEFTGELKKSTTSVLGTDVKEIDKQTQKDLKDKNNKVKKEKPLLSTKLPDATKLGSTIKPVKPSSARDKMIAKNEIKLGTDRITNLRNQNADFQAMKKGDISKMDFMKQYPGSQTTKKYNLKQIKLGKPIIKAHYEPYDLVLDYVLSEGHAETVEEAHYVMTQMDAETIQTIVEEKKTL